MTDSIDRNASSELVSQTAEEIKNVAETTKEVTTATVKGLENSTNHALEFLGMPIDVNTLIKNSIDLGINLVLALLIFFIGKWVGKRILAVINRMLSRTHLDQTVLNFLNNLLYGVMIVAIMLAALNKLGINTNSFVAVLGAAAVAIGMSLKDQLSNLAAGVMIVIFRPFGRGDVVEVGGKLGTVIDITLVNTRIRTASNHEIIIPNGDIMTTSSTNFSSLPNRRIEVLVGIGYQSNIKKAKELMLLTASKHDLVLDNPEPLVRVTALSESSVDLTLYAWTENGDWFGVQCDLLEEIKYAFDEAGVDIPFPNRTLHIEGLQDLSELIKQQGITDANNDKTP
ncbi:mechanosensitive ion channel [Moraxella haemolytica]|uniref:mechanosensitive ion channel family protein n=1 Tax=Moraxella haemolytica TaxID=2904119 RepID=UPI002542E975|nr:mechanosensitive ion channel domain-containing protein [Moraxella sp. ZY171148]WII95888.1 mechanosensitive ion channel [Moraxella sp. ZY171148]